MKEQGAKGVAKIAAMRDGRLLMGKRRDDEKWCCPGGHMRPDEDPLGAAHRELSEETGLTALSMEPLDDKVIKDGRVHVHAFKAEVEGEPNNDADPDAEFTEFQWVDPQSLPGKISRNLHSNPDIVLEALGASGPAWDSMSDEQAAA